MDPSRPRPPEPDPLESEVEAALEGVRLQELGEHGRGRGGSAGGPRLVTGTIVGTSGDDVIVELGPREQGVLSRAELEGEPEVGRRCQFTLHGRKEGLWVLSQREARALAAWDELALGALVELRVEAQSRGGLEGKIGPLSAFLPASQVSLRREEDLAPFVGQRLVCEVIELDSGRRRVLVSRRRVLERERDLARGELAGALTPGQVVSGRVTRVESYGAFVDIGGGVEGLVHVSNLSRRRVESAADAVAVGQTVKAQVLEVKEGGKRIALGLKQLEPDPWVGAAERLAPGTVATGRVARLLDFGAFIELEPGLEGLLHASQLGSRERARPRDVLAAGQELAVRVLSVDTAQRRIALTRLDERGAVLGSEDAAESSMVEDVIQKSTETRVGTNLGSLFRRALGGDAG